MFACVYFQGLIDVALECGVGACACLNWLYAWLPRRDFTQKAKSRGGSRVNIEKYLQLNYAVSTAEKISICWIRGHVESFGNDDVSIVHARK